MIQAVLQAPSIDKLWFSCAPGSFDIGKDAYSRMSKNTTQNPGENIRTRYYYNDKDGKSDFPHIHVTLMEDRLLIQSNPNNIGDPDELIRKYKAFGVGLSDNLDHWDVSRFDLERHQQMPRSADMYVGALRSSLPARLFDKATIRKGSLTVLSSGCQLQFYDKTAERKARHKAIDIADVCRMEVRYQNTKGVNRVGIKTAGQLYSMGKDGLLKIYSNQVESFFPSLRIFAGEQLNNDVQRSALDKVVNVFLDVHKDPERRGNIVTAANQVFLSLLMDSPGGWFTHSLFHEAYNIYSDMLGLDRRQCFKDRKRIDELILLKNKHEDQMPFMQQTARELLTYVA